jgi:GNAT superfamily N-acetyltransferase
VIVEPATRDDLLGLMDETYGRAMTADEFDWWFDRNPAGPRVVTAAREDGGGALGALAMSYFRMVLDGEERLAAFAVHAVTSPAARGKGVFSTLELRNEEEAAAAGAPLGLGFTNPLAGPILVCKLGWVVVTQLRIWARPKRLRRRGEGRLRPGERPSFDAWHEERYRAEAPKWGNHVVRSVDYLNWRYRDSPRDYVSFRGDGGWALVTHSTWHGFSAGVVADAVGAGKGALLRSCSAAVDADIVVDMPNPWVQAAYLAAGFVPTPRSIRFIGKKLSEQAALPKDRSGWRFSLGDLDFF